MFSPQVFDAVNPQWRQPMRTAVWRPRPGLQGRIASLMVTPQPVISRLAADLPVSAKLSNRRCGMLNREDKAKLLLRAQTSDQWHKATECVNNLAGLKCQPCSRFVPPAAPYRFRTNNFPGNCFTNRFISRLNSATFTAELGKPLARMSDVQILDPLCTDKTSGKGICLLL
jgi:hypothetical protein